jgi:hypothetical protein
MSVVKTVFKLARLSARFYLERAFRHASLAQLVEQRFRKAWVAGSNPATGSSFQSVTYA